MNRRTLTVEGEGVVDAPTADQVCAAIARVAAGGPGFLILDGPGADYAQAARRRGGFTAEWREYDGQSFRHWKAGRHDASTTNKAEVPADAPPFVLRPNELLTASDVTDILLAYHSGQKRPTQFDWREMTAMFA